MATRPTISAAQLRKMNEIGYNATSQQPQATNIQQGSMQSNVQGRNTAPVVNTVTRPAPAPVSPTRQQTHTYSTNTLGKTIENEPWVTGGGSTNTAPSVNRNVPANTNMGVTAEQRLAVQNNTPIKPFDSNQQAQQSQQIKPQVQPQVQPQQPTQNLYEGQNRFYEGAGQFTQVNPQNKQQLQQNAYYGQQANTAGSFQRLGDNNQTITTSQRASNSPLEQQFRDILANTGGIGTGNKVWEQLKQQYGEQGTSEAKKAWDWWVNKDQSNVQAVQDPLKDKLNEAPVAGGTGLDNAGVKDVLSNTSSVVDENKKALGLDTGLDWTKYIRGERILTDAIFAQRDADILSGQQSKQMFEDRVKQIDDTFTKERSLMQTELVNDQERVRQQENALNIQTQQNREKELGALLIGQAARGTNTAQSSFNRQEMGNMIYGIEEQYSVALDRLNLQRQEIRTNYDKAVLNLNKERNDVVFKHQEKIQDLISKINMADPKAKEAVGKLEMESFKNMEDIQIKHQDAQIRMQDALQKMADAENELQRNQLEDKLKIAEKFGTAYGLEEFGIQNGTPYVYPSQIAQTQKMANINAENVDIQSAIKTYQASGGDASVIKPLYTAWDNYSAAVGDKKADQARSSIANTISSIADINSQTNLTKEQKDLLINRELLNVAMTASLYKENSTITTQKQNQEFLARAPSVNNAFKEYENTLKTLGYSNETIQSDDFVKAKLIAKNILSGSYTQDALKALDPKDLKVAEAMLKMRSTLLTDLASKRVDITGVSMSSQEKSFVDQILPMEYGDLSTIKQLSSSIYSKYANNYNTQASIALGGINRDFASAIPPAIGDINFNQSASDTKLQSGLTQKQLTTNQKSVASDFTNRYIKPKKSGGLFTSAYADAPVQDRIIMIPSGVKSGLECGSFVNRVYRENGVPHKTNFGDTLDQKKRVANISINNGKPMEDIQGGFSFVSDTGTTTGHVGLIENVSPDGRVTIVDSNANYNKEGAYKINRRTYDSIGDFIKKENVQKFYNPYK